MNYKQTTAAVLIAAFVLPAHSETLSVTPYRPTVSNPAQLSYPGWLEVESGWNRNSYKDGTVRDSLLYTFKLAFTEDIGIMLGGDAFVSQTDLAGARQRGFGDTMLLVKQRWSVDETSNAAFGVEYGFKTPTAKTPLGSGKTDYIVNGIYSTNLGQHTVDLNLNLIQLGAVQANESRQQWGWATTWSHPAGEDWVVAAELSGTARQGTQPLNQFLVAASYASSEHVMWDAGVAHGISSASQNWSVFAGVAVLLGKVF